MALKEPNGSDIPSENPVQVRRPLRFIHQDVSPAEPQSSAIIKLVENSVAQCTRLDSMDSDLVKLGEGMLLGFAALSRQLTVQHLPPLRRKEDSEHAIKEMAENIGKEAEVDAQRIIDSPDDTLNPATVGKLITEKVEQALAAQREADVVKKLKSDAAKAEEERLAKIKREDDDATDKKRQRRNFWVITLSGTILLVLGVALAFTQGRLTGHSEERAETPQPVMMPMLPMLVSASAAPEATATASASAARPHR